MFYKLQKQYRLKDYDYSSDGFYFVTVCTQDREDYFGQIIDCKMQLSQIGYIAQKYWLKIPDHFPSVELDEFVVMPNHIHGIIVIDNFLIVGTGHCPVPTGCPVPTDSQFGHVAPKSLSTIIGSFKSIVTKTIKRQLRYFAWQSRFHDRIIRNEQELNKIRHYIILNPEQWETDRNNPDNIST